MLKRVVRVIKSVKFLLGAAVFTSVLFLFHFANVSVVFDNHKDGVTVIDRLRTRQVIRTKSVAKAEPKEELVEDADITESPPLNILDSLATTNSASPSIALPGALEHPILQLSDEKFRTTPVSEMFEWYGQAEGGGTCAEDFGYKLIEKWRNMKQSYCRPVSNSTTSSSKHLGSTIDCYLIHQTRHHGDGDNLCVMKNVAVDMRLFADDAKTRTVVKQYVDTRHAKQPYIKFPRGFIEGDCDPVPSLWKSNYMPGWNADLTVGAFESTSKEASGNKDTAAVCEEWISHPVIVTQRDTFANFFHDSEDFFNVFIAMAVLDYTPGEVQMFLTDLYPKGPFWDIWSKAYSQGIASSNDRDRINNNNPSTTGALPALTAWDLRQSFKHITPGKKVCFKELTIGIFGPAAPMTVASWDTPCRRTALVRAYSDYIIRGLQLHAHTHYVLPTPSRAIVITYMSRRPSKEWPEKKYCDSENSFFLCELWAHFGERKLGRMIRNDPEVVAALKGLEERTFPNADRIVVNDVNYNVLSFEEQILTDLKTDIMIGPHGAGLMHNIFMRDRATLIELFVDGSSVNRHFHNLASWFGRRYSGVSASNPISIPSLLREVEMAIQNIDTSKY